MSKDVVEQENLLIKEAQVYFEETISEAATRGVTIQNKSWFPGEVTPRWEEACIKKDKKYEYVFVPIFTQNNYAGRQLSTKDSIARFYRVYVVQTICIRKNAEGKHSAAYITLIPTKSESKNKVLESYLDTKGIAGNFSGRVLYNDLATFRLMAADKVDNGVFEWGYSRGAVSEYASFKEYSTNMLKNISIIGLRGGRSRMDGGELEEVVITWCRKCNIRIDDTHECPDEEQWWEEDESSEDDSSTNEGWNNGGSGSGGGGGGTSTDQKKIIAEAQKAKNIMANLWIKQRADNAWTKTKEATKTEGRHERGFAVFYDPNTGKYYAGKEQVGPMVTGAATAPLDPGSLNPKDHNIPTNAVIVGYYHTHTPHSNEMEGHRGVGLSNKDIIWSNNNGVTIIARDYVGELMSDGKYWLFPKHDIDAPDKDYSYTPSR